MKGYYENSNLTTVEKNILYICRYEYYKFINKANVVGVGLGYKIKNGFNTRIKCIKVFVSNKLSVNNLSKTDIIPKFYKGIVTDVIDSGQFYLYSLTEKIRPTICGYSIGPYEIREAATLGCIVKNSTEKYILTCNHGFVIKLFSIGGKVLQPGSIDGGKSLEDIVGKLKKFIPLKPISTFKKPTNIVDACLIGILNESMVTSEIYAIGKLNGINHPLLNQPVVKVGKSTELTTGKVTAINATVKVIGESGTYIYIDQILTTKMSEPGDSGAILVGNGNFALGLMCGGSKSYCICNDINNVLKMLDVTIETN